jgi:hypothetical protein
MKGFVIKISSVIIPKKIEEEKRDPKLIHAMNVEMDVLKKNDTCKIISLPNEKKKTMECQWVYTKYNANGKIERYKTRLVTKRYTQTYDFFLMLLSLILLEFFCLL